ncbi:MAG: VanZ family protein [Leifsonia sp.]
MTSRQKPAPSAQRRLLIVLFAVYLVMLVWAILWKFEVPFIGQAALLPRPLKLVPFVASGDYQASHPSEVVANVILFVPFGIFLGMLAPRRRWWQLAGIFVAASLVLETVQHLISTGSFDTTDVIDNTVGGLVGLGVLVLARRWLGDRAGAVVTRVGLIAGVVSVMAIAAFVASPLHFSAQRDVVVPRPGISGSP